MVTKGTYVKQPDKISNCATKFESSNLKNDIVKAKNAEITNYGIMRIFNEVASNKQWINQGTICIPNLKKKNQNIPSMFSRSRANKVPNEIDKWIVKIIVKNGHIGIQ